MKVTVVVINCNYGEYLPAALDSALNQSWKDFEVVVVDDGSIDDSRDIILSYGRRVIPIFKTRGGHVSAVNAGYSAATGDLCIFLDADDILYPNCLEVVVREIRVRDVKVQYRLDTIDRDGVDQQMPFPHFPTDLTPQSIRAQSLRYGVYPWTVSSGNAFTREFLNLLLPINTQEIYRSPDGYLNKMAPLFGDVRSVRHILGAYRVHGANTWAQTDKELNLDPIVRWLKFDQVLHRHFEREAAKKSIVVTRYDELKTLQQTEYRLLATRFDPHLPHSKVFSTVRLLLQGVEAAKIAPNVSFAGQIVWLIWFVFIAFMPRFIVRSIFRAARAQTGRTFISRVLVSWAHGPSRSKRN